MANRRMFSKSVVDTDLFLELPISAQALYFHLGMAGDDDGFVSAPKKIIRSVGCSGSDLQSLVDAGFAIQFSSGVIVITDWLANNCIKSDRYHESSCVEEKSLLSVGKNGRYTLEPEWNQSGTNLEPEERVGKDRVGKSRQGEDSLGEFRAAEEEADLEATGSEQENMLKSVGGNLGQGVVFLTDEQERILLDKLGLDLFDRYLRKLSDYIIAHPDKNPKSHYRAILRWWTEDSTT